MTMAIVKVTYTKNKIIAKSHIRYIAHRPGKSGRQTVRELYGPDGELSKQQAYRLIDSARKGTTFFRIIISPDPMREDTERDLYLSEIAHLTMARLEKHKKQQIAYLAAEHNDHAPHRHVHVLALLTGKLTPFDFKLLREEATTHSLFQRKERDLARLAREQQAREREEAQWGV